MLKPLLTAATLCLALTSTTAQAATVTVDVQSAANSSSGGTGLATGIILSIGQLFTVTADPLDTWSLGPNTPCTRESNADGLTACYGIWTQGNLQTLHGKLVGKIGTGGDFFAVGSNFSGLAAAAGELFLYNWDSNRFDNSGSIKATISAVSAAVPVPAAGLMLLGALGGLAAFRRRKTA